MIKHHSLKHSGFTLLEILIALTILAIVGVMMAAGLRAAVNVQQRLTQKAEQLTQIQTAILIMERDLSQMINRPIVDASSRIHPAVEIRTANQELFFEFTRAGVINPYSLENRSTLQRIQYHYDGNKLSRIFWKELDRTKDTPTETQVLLTKLNGFKVNLIKKGDQNNPVDPSHPDLNLPTAVEISLESDSFGLVSRFIKLIGEFSP